MKTTRLYWFFIPPVVLLFMTLLGVVTGWTTILAFCGLTIFAFWTFIAAGAGSLGEWLKKLKGWLELKYRRSYPSLSFVIDVLTEGSLLVRAVAFSGAKWTVDFYLSLCKGGLGEFFEKADENLVFSFLAAALAIADLSRGKSTKDHGMPTRILTAYGAIQSLKNLVLLMAVVHPSVFEKLEVLFSWFPWFLDQRSRLEVMRLGFEIGLGPTLVFLVFGFWFFVVGIQVARDPKAPDDARSFGFALAAVTGWLLAVPLYSLASFLWFVMNDPQRI